MGILKVKLFWHLPYKAIHLSFKILPKTVPYYQYLKKYDGAMKDVNDHLAFVANY